MFNTLIVLLGGCLLLSPILFFLGSSRAELEQLPSNASFLCWVTSPFCPVFWSRCGTVSIQFVAGQRANIRSSWLCGWRRFPCASRFPIGSFGAAIRLGLSRLPLWHCCFFGSLGRRWLTAAKTRPAANKSQDSKTARLPACCFLLPLLI